MQPPLAAAGPGRVWLRTQDGNYVQMSAEARATVLRNQAASGGGGVEQVCPHGLPLPAAHEDEVERAKVAALKADFVAQEVQNTAAVPVRMTAAGESVRANIAQFGAQAARLDAVALRTFPPLADAALQNVANLAGAIAVADRGSNAFVDKARRAQDAGAIGLVIVNSADGDEAYVPICSPDGGGDAIRIPVVCVKRSDGLRFRNPCAVTLEYGYMPAGYGSDEEASTQPAAGAADGAGSSAGDTSTGTAELMAPDPEAVSFLVTVPDGQVGGSRMVVTAPDGRQVAIDVPAGVVSGQQLQVNLPAVRDHSDDDEDGDSLSYDEDDYSDYTDEGEVDYSDDEEGAGVGLSPSSTEGREEGRRRDGSKGDGLGGDDPGEDPEDPPLAFEVTVPTGVESGQQLRVQAPDGRSAVITVPAGVGSGQRIRVQLPPKPPAETALRQGEEMNGEEAAAPPGQEGLQGGERPLQPRPPSATDHVATGSSKEAETAAPPEAAGAGTAPTSDKPDPAATMLTVVVPEGVVAGQQLRVQAPDGRHAMITVPTGVLPGQQLRLSLPAPAPDSSSLSSAAAEVEGGARTPTPDREAEDRHGERVGTSRASEADVESGIGSSIPTSSSGASRASELPPATPGKLWYRDTDGELRQLTPQQRRMAVANLREQGMTPAAQLDDSGALLPVPPELAAELAESSQRAAAEDGLSYIDSLMQAMLGTAWKYLTGDDLLPTDPQNVLSAR